MSTAKFEGNMRHLQGGREKGSQSCISLSDILNDALMIMWCYPSFALRSQRSNNHPHKANKGQEKGRSMKGRSKWSWSTIRCGLRKTWYQSSFYLSDSLNYALMVMGPLFVMGTKVVAYYWCDLLYPMGCNDGVEARKLLRQPLYCMEVSGYGALQCCWLFNSRRMREGSCENGARAKVGEGMS